MVRISEFQHRLYQEIAHRRARCKRYYKKYYILSGHLVRNISETCPQNFPDAELFDPPRHIQSDQPIQTQAHQ